VLACVLPPIPRDIQRLWFCVNRSLQSMRLRSCIKGCIIQLCWLYIWMCSTAKRWECSAVTQTATAVSSMSCTSAGVVYAAVCCFVCLQRGKRFVCCAKVGQIAWQLRLYGCTVYCLSHCTWVDVRLYIRQLDSGHHSYGALLLMMAGSVCWQALPTLSVQDQDLPPLWH